ncbi:MAG: rhombotarget lipoprotein [Verrucomicrobia bacterium RIFCSPLOWO2_12_FULL_64_8]|nr:MAG: rhombotarget lipoprotein [Verrucomicrobia bacterium RIFCSPLOWO2_12_FULL_64_8]
MVLAAGCALLLAACEMWNLHGPRKVDRSSSVVSFLYPNTAEPLITPSVPVLRLPLKVGLAFVPEALTQKAADFTEAQKSVLLKRVAAEFKSNNFIESIDIIPATYLRSAGGFANLNQVRGLMGVDVMVLVAYDQMQFTDQNKLSLAYWTIVGAYVIHGNKNDTHTLMEAVVYDIPSRKLLFRAPGVSNLSASSTAVEVRDRLRRDSAKGFDEATDDLIKNLQTELAAFKEQIKVAPGGVQIEHKAGYGGSGGLEAWFAGMLATLGFLRCVTRRART